MRVFAWKSRSFCWTGLLCAAAVVSPAGAQSLTTPKVDTAIPMPTVEQLIPRSGQEIEQIIPMPAVDQPITGSECGTGGITLRLPVRDYVGAVEYTPWGPPSDPTGLYLGHAVDTTNPAHPVRADLRLALCTVGGDAGDGSFRIAPPLASHGVISLRASGDSVIITTTSDDGDRIAWAAKRARHDLRGTYTLIRGQGVTRGGRWFVRFAGGREIPPSLRPWR